MKFAFYEKIDIKELEEKLRNLALEKDYKFDKEVETLNDDEVINKSSYDISRKLLKIFGDKSMITTFHVKHHKHNYFVTVGQSEDNKINGISVIFHNKPIKQLGKMGLAVLTLSTLPVSGVIIPLAGLVTSVSLATSSVKNLLTIKGSLKSDLTTIIDEVTEGLKEKSE
ncbi:hypothetical protein [Macrococcus equi]|uniref:hypothetical protein n=1 Tax=Macrococcus equi TaxID=3395462 RepID=UPI0039BEA916